MSPLSEPKVACDAIKKKYADILKANGILDEVEKVTTHEPDELKGEHMASASVYVHVEFKDPAKKPKNLFVKAFVDNEGHTAMIKAMRIMEKETHFFTEFLPEAREFCKQYPGCENMLNFFPKCLYGDDEIVVLENVVLDDTFMMLRKEEYQDLYTAKFVLGNLAKLHAVTGALIEETGRKTFREKHELLISDVFDSENNPFLKQMLDGGVNTSINILNVNPIDGSAETIEKLNSYSGKTVEMMMNLLAYNVNSKLCVINHGDCWNNNMLFKKDSETGKVNDHIFVDLQVTRMGSPSLDLGYFLFTSVKPKVRRAHLQELLLHYFGIFQKTLESFNKKCPVTYEEFFEDYKRHCSLGFFFHLTVVTGMEALKDMDVNEIGDGPNGMMDMFSNAINKWVENNPDKASTISVEIVACVKEFVKLTSV